MASRAIKPGDADYNDIHEAWELNGRPGQFDRQGSFGGAIYSVIDRELDNPTFYQIASEEPTIVNQDTGRIEQEGWLTVNDRGGHQRFWKDPATGETKTRMVPYPNTLE